MPPPPCAGEALEPRIDTRAVEIHALRHHPARIDNPNAEPGHPPLMAG